MNTAKRETTDQLNGACTNVYNWMMLVRQRSGDRVISWPEHGFGLCSYASIRRATDCVEKQVGVQQTIACTMLVQDSR